MIFLDSVLKAAAIMMLVVAMAALMAAAQGLPTHDHMIQCPPGLEVVGIVHTKYWYEWECIPTQIKSDWTETST